MKLLQSLNVLVLGLGESGLAMARWCAKHGAQVRVWDSRERPPQLEALNGAGTFFSSPTLDATALQGAQLVLRSPGLAPTDPRIAALLDAATKAGIRVANELDLFVAALNDLRETRDYAPKLLAVTGTNGKTTTTALTALLVERAGRTVQAAGNIGPTMLDTLAAAIDGDALPEVWVLELSSFQLHGVDGFEPHAAVVLNVTQDHLDWHGTMAAYVAAKARVYGSRGTVVVNRDDPLVAALPATLVAEPPPKPKARKRPPPRPLVSFGLQAPTRAGDFGLVVDAGMAWLVRATDSADGDELLLQRLMPADALHIRGRHNAANALAALALATAIGCAVAPMLHALRDYRGEPHRVEFIASVGGVDAFDDSKGTNVGATVAALDGLGADKAPSKLVVILGGDGKGQDFAPLTAPLARHARAVATLGRDAAAIEAVLPGDVPAQRHDSLDAATRWCFAQARSGDAVLLSPACASLDMFRNYAHRAEVFVAAVREVAAERGEMV
jgi:UDP-N-acetylmuramoylalanine--D-glutamate ligase